MTAASWTISLQLWAATSAGTTDPATIPPADPSVAPVVIVGFCLMVLGVVCLLASAIGKR